jgi:hypothetical protein
MIYFCGHMIHFCGHMTISVACTCNYGVCFLPTLARFLKVSPSTALDRTLLESILFFLSYLLSAAPTTADSALSALVTHKELVWLCGVSFEVDSVPTQLLQASLHNAEAATELEDGKRYTLKYLHTHPL